MNLKIKHKNKHLECIAVSFLAVLCCAFMLFVGIIPNYQSKTLAEEGSSSTTSTSNGLLVDFTPTTLNLLDSGAENSKTNPYLITSKEDLLTIAYWVNSDFSKITDEVQRNALLDKQTAFSRASYRLTTHLNLSSWNWEPIGTIDNPFLGNFDGYGHTIYGLTIIKNVNEEDSFSAFGLFGYVKYFNDGVNEYKPHIQKLGLKDTIIKTNGCYVGSLVGNAEGSFSVTPNITYMGTTNPTASVLIEQCYNTGYVEGADYVGGLVGTLTSGAYIYNCFNAPSTKTLNRFSENGEIYNLNYDIYSNSETGSVGGLVGTAVDNGSYAVMCHSINSAFVSSANTAYFGPLVGDATKISRSLTEYTTLISFKTCYKGTLTTSVGSIVYAYDRIASKFSSLRYSYASPSGDGIWVHDDVVGSKIWIRSSKVNDGLPLLANVPFLMKFEFDAKVNGSDQSILSADLVSRVAEANNDKIALRLDDNSVLIAVKSDSSFVIETKTIEGSIDERTYVIDSAKAIVFKPYAKSYHTSTVSSTTYNDSTGATSSFATQTFTFCDATITANYNYREYEITLEARADNITDPVTNITIDNNGTQSSIENIKSLSVTAKYNDNLTLQVTPVKGYKVGEWSDATINNGQIVLSVKNFVDSKYVSVVPQSLTTYVSIVPKTYNLSINSRVINSIAKSGYSVFAKEFASSTAQIGDSLVFGYSIITDESDPNYNANATNLKFKYWTITVYSNGTSTTYTNATEENATFVVPDLDDNSTIDIVAVFDKKSFNVNLINSSVKGSLAIYDYNAGAVIEGDNEFYYDEQFYIKMQPNTGYKISAVTINDGTNDVNYDLTTTSARPFQWELSQDGTYGLMHFFGIDTNLSITGVFVEKEYLVEINLYNLDDNGSATGATLLDENQLEHLQSKTYKYKSKLTLNVVLDEGYELVSVEVNSVAINTATFDILGDTVVVVKVKLRDFQVYTAFGYVDNSIYNVDSSNIKGAGEYNFGSTANINVTIPEMFEIKYWTINGNIVESSETSTSLSDIRSNITVVAYLGIKNVTVTFGVAGDDDFDNWYKIKTVDAVYDYTNDFVGLVLKYGDMLNLEVNSAYFDNGERVGKYEFAYWYCNGVPVSSNRYLNMFAEDTNLSIKAIFRPTELSLMGDVAVVDYKTNAVTNYAYAGSILGLNSTNYPYATQITLSARANNGYQFVGWYQNTQNGLKLVSNEVDYDLTLEKDLHLSAVFMNVAKVTISNKDSLSGTQNGAGTYAVGQKVEISANANEGYKFLRWIIGGQTFSYLNTVSFDMPAYNLYFIAEYEPVYTVSYSANDTAFGQVIGSTSGQYKENVTLEAVSANNCSFVGWVIDDVVVSTANKLNITLNGDVKVQALFKKNFDWNIIIVLVGCLLFAVVIIAASSAYIKMKEAEPMPIRALINGKDDKDAIYKNRKRNALRDEIDPVPTRKVGKPNVQPIPVRKITVIPSNHKGEQVKRKAKANEEKPTLKTDVNEKSND